MKSFLLRGAVIATLPFLIAGCERHPVQSHKPMYTVGCQNNPYLMKYGCSVDKIQTAAENGDPDAQYGLGYMYYYGIDTVRDQQTAQLWIKRAADQGQPLAQKALSLIGSGAKFDDLHQAASGGGLTRGSNTEGAGDDTPTPSQTIVQQPDTDVKKMNSGVPAEPITNHLPAYHSGQSSKKSVENTPIASAKPQVIAMDESDPRLADNAKPVVATGASQDKQASKSPTTEMLAKASDKDNNTSSMNMAAQSPSAEISGPEKTFSTQMASNDRSDFTMQLMASDKMADLKAFAASHQLSSHAHYYQTARNGKPWYMLTYGQYSTEKQAVTALAQLPADLKRSHPWVKSMATINEEVRLNRVIA